MAFVRGRLLVSDLGAKAAFRSNPRFVRKVAVATNISVDELTSLEVEDPAFFLA